MALTEEELLVLAALAREVIRANGNVTEEEAVALEKVSASVVKSIELGGGAYRMQAVQFEVGDPGALVGLMKRAATLFPDEEAVERAARGVTRPEARTTIRAAIALIAAADGTTSGDTPLLAWLDEAWRDG